MILICVFTNSLCILDRDNLIKSDSGDLPCGDFIDEALYYFKANMFASQFDIRTDADRNLVYLTLYVIECLKVIAAVMFLSLFL